MVIEHEELEDHLQTPATWSKSAAMPTVWLIRAAPVASTATQTKIADTFPVELSASARPPRDDREEEGLMQ